MTHGTTARDEDNALLLQGEIAEAITSEIGLKADMAAEWAARITGALRRRLGAQQIYIPRPSNVERDAAIYREYDGTNAGDVCARHGVSRSRMHDIVKEQRELAIARGRANPVSSLKTGRAPG